MNTMIRMTWVPMLALVLGAGCALQQKEVEQQLVQPAAINCATAQGDIRLLEHEKAHVVQRIAEGATAIYPAGIVVGVLTGTESTKLQVAIVEYNQKIDQRIAEIKSTCGIE